MLNEKMTALITQHTLGFVASVNKDGQPNLSPKGTFVVLDNKTLMFSEIRSPNTVRNINNNPQLDINFIDPFIRKGVRIKGIATVIEKKNAEYDRLFPYFEQWGELTKRIRRIVKIKIIQAQEISSPIYDMGAKEEDMINIWSEKYQRMYD